MEFFPGSHKLKRLTFMGNGKFKACCPAHEDRNPSLYIAKGDKAWMFKCWSGCSIQAICEAMDIKISDLWFDNSKPPKQNIKDTDEYHLVFIMDHTEHKSGFTKKDWTAYRAAKRKLEKMQSE